MAKIKDPNEIVHLQVADGETAFYKGISYGPRATLQVRREDLERVRGKYDEVHPHELSDVAKVANPSRAHRMMRSSRQAGVAHDAPGLCGARAPSSRRGDRLCMRSPVRGGGGSASPRPCAPTQRHLRSQLRGPGAL